MNNTEKITELTKLWYSLLIDHHKDRDCHFYINCVWSYGNEPYYRIEHYGYVCENLNEDNRYLSIQDAEKDLITMLKKMIVEEADTWLRRCSEPDNWDYEIAIRNKQRFENILKKVNIL